MKKITKPLSVLAWVLFASMSIFALNANAQCPQNTIPFGTTAAPTASGDTVVVTTCAFAGEYSTFTGLVAGEIYRAIVSGGTNTPYLTVYQTGDTVPVAFAFTSRAWTVAASGDYEVHVTQSDTMGNFCLSESACHTVSMECLSCDTPVLGCTDPIALNYDSTANTDDGSCVYPVPTNDSCANALQLLCGDTISGTTVGATIDGSAGTCGTSLNTAPGVWYYLVSGSAQVVTLTMCGSSYDTKLGVFNGLDCDSLVCVDGNDDFCGLQSGVTFTAAAGQVYPILVTGFSTATGNYELAVACEPVVLGCTDPNATNYNPAANSDDGSCVYPPQPSNDSCHTAMAITVGSGGSCPIVSANTISATPSDLSSTSCDVGTNNWDVWYSFVAGAPAYEIDVTLGTATLVEGAVYGDTCGGPSLFCFFNADGGQITGLTIGETYLLQLWTDDFGTSTNAGTFDFCLKEIISGCTDPAALNYDSTAVIDDGSCVYPGCAADEAQLQVAITIGSFAEEVHWTLVSTLGDTVATAACAQYAGALFGSVFTTVVCVDTCVDYIFNAYDDWGDGWNGGSFTITNLDDGCVVATGTPSNGLGGDASATCNGSDLESSSTINTCNIVGCTNPLASNYNPCASTDDGSCIIPGCTDPLALNYDSTATVDDGSCAYPGVVNDSCAAAIPASVNAPGVCPVGSIDVNTSGATASALSSTSCDVGTNNIDVWYTFVAPASGFISIDVALNTAGLVEGAMYDACGGTEIACYFNAAGAVSPQLTPGNTYYLQLWTDDFNTGTFGFCLEEISSGCTDPAALNYDSTAVIDDGSCMYAPCDSDQIQYTLTVTPSGFPGEIGWTFVCDSTGDTLASAACGSYGPQTVTVLCLDTNQTYTFSAYDDWGDGWNGGTYSFVETSSGNVVASGSPNNGVAGDAIADCAASQLEESIVIFPGQILGCTDPGALNYNPAATVDDGSCVYVPANDLCADAIQVNCGDVVSGSTTAATSTGAPGTCVTSASTAGGVWYFFVGTGDDVVASLCGSNYDTKIFVYEAPNNGCDSLVCVTGNDDFCGLQSEVTFTSNTGTLYIIYVAGFGSATGNYTLSMTCLAPPCPVPTGLNATNITTKSVKLNWNAAAGAVGYQLTGSRVGFPPISPITLGPVTMFNVNNLTPGACYYWQIRSVCSVDGTNVSAYSPLDTFCMLDPCPVPVPLFETNLTSTSVTLNWAVVAGAVSYKIYGKAASSSTVVTINVNNASQSTFQVNNLPPNTTFQWAMTATCTGSGTSAFSPINTFTTLPGPAPKTQLDNVFNTGTVDNFGVDIYPNPTSSVLNLKFSEVDAEDVSIEMLDMSGRTIKLTSTEVIDGNVITMNVANVANGVYQVVITSGDHIAIERVMIAR